MPDCVQTIIIEQPLTVTVTHGTAMTIASGVQGPPGKDGRDGIGHISDNADNRLTTGPDGGLYVPELTCDPLAIYILSK